MIAWRVALSLGCAMLGPVLASRALPELARDSRDWASTVVDRGPFPKRLFDARGAVHLLQSKPTRIVSSVLAADEILLELVPASALAGVTFLIDDKTSSVARAPRALPRVYGSVEGTLALRPDLVFVADYTSAETTTQLMAAGPAVVRLNPVHDFGDVERNIELVGRAAGAEPEAEALIARLHSRLEQARSRGRRSPTRRVLVWGFGHTFGQGCLQDDIVAWAGAQNAARELGVRGMVALAPERVITLDPDVIVVTTSDSEPHWGGAHRLESPAWSAVRAVRRGAVLSLPSAWLSSVTHHAALAADALALALSKGPS